MSEPQTAEIAGTTPNQQEMSVCRPGSAYLISIRFNIAHHYINVSQSAAILISTVSLLSDYGHRSYIDPGFGVPGTWNIDLLSGYTSRFLST